MDAWVYVLALVVGVVLLFIGLCAYVVYFIMRLALEELGEEPEPWSLRFLNWWKSKCVRLSNDAGGDQMRWGTYKEIHSRGGLYLTRMYFTRSVYLHYYHTSDGDPALHDHPWRWALSFVLWGWYDEERLTGVQTAHAKGDAWIPGQALTRYTRRRWFNALLGTSWHRVARVRAHSMTLFITGPYFKSWSFMLPDGSRVHWKEYVATREGGR